MTAPRPDLAVMELRDWHHEVAIRGAASVRELPEKYRVVAAQEAERHKHWADALDRLLARCADNAIPDGWKLVPVEPTEIMWSGLARQLVFWQRQARPTGAALYFDLTHGGWEIPDWLRKEIPDNDHVPPKGTVAACIYKAQLAAAPQPPKGNGDE